MKLFNVQKSFGLMRLPTGCFTVDRNGEIIISTLPQTFPRQYIDRMVALVLKTFKAAHDAQLVFQELHVNYAALKLTAREMRGGAIIFFMPHSLTEI